MFLKERNIGILGWEQSDEFVWMRLFGSIAKGKNSAFFIFPFYFQYLKEKAGPEDGGQFIFLYEEPSTHFYLSGFFDYF